MELLTYFHLYAATTKLWSWPDESDLSMSLCLEHGASNQGSLGSGYRCSPSVQLAQKDLKDTTRTKDDIDNGDNIDSTDNIDTNSQKLSKTNKKN
jgi:hypothetical protein